MMCTRNLFALCSAGVFLSANALALKTDRAQPMDVKAQSWQGVMSGKQVFNGSVRIIQGSLKISADKGTLQYKDGQVGNAEFQGSPARVEQAQDSGGMVVATAKSIQYDLAKNIVLLNGNVRIEEGGNVTTGERFEYALDTGAIKGDGGSGEISMRLVPKPAGK
jgi:lipopolysaccharide export system protein LptA